MKKLLTVFLILCLILPTSVAVFADAAAAPDDMLALALLPPYLAAELLSAENDVLSAWFMNQYREALQDVRSNAAGEFEAIPTPYGLF